ncbi:MAG TPA: ATP-binding protein [Solirubrobacterales bacterium]|nr:ATP-binding protein [Solirubrobacterales bacterium]
MQGPLESLLAESPAVAVLGPRQVGKTTLALAVAEGRPSTYLDLESPADRARISEPELYFADHADELLILDEIHRAPGIFEALRGTIDRGRREDRAAGRFLMLGSAAIELLAQSGETLAGRISYAELDPFDISELGGEAIDAHWLRGGFPESYLASSDTTSLRRREDFIRTYLEREIPQLGPRIPAETLRRLWTMLAHSQGQLLNAASIARGLGVSSPTVNAYLDLLVDLLLVRRLQPRLANVGKRQIRSPKTYVRDSGLLHALLGLGDKEALLGHPVLGASWEGYAIENLIDLAPDRVEPSFYRTSGGAEIDLVLRWPEGKEWAIGVKRSLSPRPTRGMRSAIADLEPERSFIVYPGEDRYRVAEEIEVIGLPDLAADLAG